MELFWKDDRFNNKVFNTGTAFSMVSFMERGWSTIFQGHFNNNVMGYDHYCGVMKNAYRAYVLDSEARSGRRHKSTVKLAQEAQGAEDTVKYLKRKPLKKYCKETLTAMAHHSELDGKVEAMQANEKDMEAVHASTE